jgi:hypothetical protein
MRLWMAKVSRGERVRLVPTDEDSRDALRRIGDGECISVELLRSRSVRWNKMFWAVCREIGLNQDPQRTEKSICNELKIRAGHYEVLPVEGLPGVEVRMPKSIAFDNLTADEWEELWPSLELAIRERFGDGYLSEWQR